jgi:hypothetical protein
MPLPTEESTVLTFHFSPFAIHGVPDSPFFLIYRAGRLQTMFFFAKNAKKVPG